MRRTRNSAISRYCCRRPTSRSPRWREHDRGRQPVSSTAQSLPPPHLICARFASVRSEVLGMSIWVLGGKSVIALSSQICLTMCDGPVRLNPLYVLSTHCKPALAQKGVPTAWALTDLLGAGSKTGSQVRRTDRARRGWWSREGVEVLCRCHPEQLSSGSLRRWARPCRLSGSICEGTGRGGSKHSRFPERLHYQCFSWL